MEFDAIWDTGATNSVISQAVVDACGLAPTGITEVHGVHGTARAETYLVNIALPNKVIFPAVRVTKGQAGGADILIGMDIIASGDFSVTNCDGTTKFSFRAPSIEHIDYAEQARKLESAAAAGARLNRAERQRQQKKKP